MHLLALSSLLLLLACQGPEGPMGPVANPKVNTAQAADTTGCQVVINISGETVVYEGDNPDTNTVTVYDTVSAGGNDVLANEFDFLSIYLFTADYRRGGWTIENDIFSPTTVKAVYFHVRSISDDDDGEGDRVNGDNWVEFDTHWSTETPEDDIAPTYEARDGELFISDPDIVIWYGRIGVLLAE